MNEKNEHSSVQAATEANVRGGR